MRFPRSSVRAAAAVALTGMFTLTACSAAEESPPAPTPAAAVTHSENSASAEWEEHLIDGPEKPEDLIELSNGAVIVSGMAADPGSEDGGSGNLYTLDPATGDMSSIWPDDGVVEALDTRRFDECPGPLDGAVASPHGLGATTTPEGTEYLYVVNHGGRESVEVFEVAGLSLIHI